MHSPSRRRPYSPHDETYHRVHRSMPRKMSWSISQLANPERQMRRGVAATEALSRVSSPVVGDRRRTVVFRRLGGGVGTLAESLGCRTCTLARCMRKMAAFVFPQAHGISARVWHESPTL